MREGSHEILRMTSNIELHLATGRGMQPFLFRTRIRERVLARRAGKLSPLRAGGRPCDACGVVLVKVGWCIAEHGRASDRKHDRAPAGAPH